MEKISLGKSLPKKLIFPLFCASVYTPLVFSGPFFGRRGGETSRSAVSVWDSFPVSLPRISALAGNTSRASSTGITLESGTTGWKVCSLPRKPRNGAAVAKTLITSDPRACLRSSEPTTQVALSGPGCEPRASLHRKGITWHGVLSTRTTEKLDTPNNYFTD